MDRGKNVRSPSLEKGTHYIMKTWTKVHTFEQVLFDGFVSGGQTFKSPNKQLKDMLPSDLYMFVGDTSGKFSAKMQDNCLVHATSEIRLTFASVLGATTALTPSAETAPIEATTGTEIEPTTEVVSEPETEIETVMYGSDNPGATIEEALANNDAEIAASASEPSSASDEATETTAERRNARRRAQRAAAKAAKDAATPTAPATDSEMQVAA